MDQFNHLAPDYYGGNIMPRARVGQRRVVVHPMVWDNGRVVQATAVMQNERIPYPQEAIDYLFVQARAFLQERMGLDEQRLGRLAVRATITVQDNSHSLSERPLYMIQNEALYALFEVYDDDQPLNDLRLTLSTTLPRRGAARGRPRKGQTLPDSLAYLKGIEPIPRVPKGLCGQIVLFLNTLEPDARKDIIKQPFALQHETEQWCLRHGMSLEPLASRDMTAFLELPGLETFRTVVLTQMGSVHPDGVCEGRAWVEADGHNTIYLFLDYDGDHYYWVTHPNAFGQSRRNSKNHRWCHKCLAFHTRNSFMTHVCVPGYPQCDKCGIHSSNIEKHKVRLLIREFTFFVEVTSSAMDPFFAVLALCTSVHEFAAAATECAFNDAFRAHEILFHYTPLQSPCLGAYMALIFSCRTGKRWNARNVTGLVTRR